MLWQVNACQKMGEVLQTFLNILQSLASTAGPLLLFDPKSIQLKKQSSLKWMTLYFLNCTCAFNHLWIIINETNNLAR